MSENPGHPDAHPTAPGGMSQKALVKELVERHGWDKAEAKAMRWPDQIDAVVQGRLDEDRQRDAEHDIDPDALFAEMTEAQAEVAGESLFIGMPKTRDFIFDNHAGAGPSGAERWMHCTESLGAARRFLETLSPNQQAEFAKGSTAALQGTTAHAAGEAELLLALGRIDEAERDATLLELAIMPEDGEAYDSEMAEHIETYVDLVSQYVADRGEDHVLIEQRVHAAIPLVENLTLPEDHDVHTIAGSGDTIILPTEDEPDLVVIDYKHGEGLDVTVEENPQVRIYALGALDLLTDDEGQLVTNVETVTYYIVQPRNGGIKSWTETLGDLLDWRDDVLSPALTAALTGEGAVFAPSEDTCQWCPAKGSCAALAEQRVEQAADLFDVIVEAEYVDGHGAFPETGTLDNARLGSLLSQIEGLVRIRDDLKEEVQRRLHRGEEIPGFKMVGYTPPRKWLDNAVEKLDPDQWDRLWKHSLLTPKQAEAVLKQHYGVDDPSKIIGDLHDRPVQRPVVARAEDRRHEWKGAPPEQMFTDMDSKEEA
jgi:hypothetical protein